MRRILALALFVALPLVAAVETPFALAERAGKAYEAGNYALAVELYRALTVRIPISISSKVNFARALARQGKKDEALAQLEVAAAFGGRFDAADPAWAPLRSDPRFERTTALMRSRSAPLIRSETAFLLEKDLIPESIAFDPKSGAFFVGSLYKAKIIRVAPAGSAPPRVTDFVSSKRDGLLSVVGMKIDAERRELWACAGNFVDSPPMEHEDPSTRGNGSIFRFHLDTGKLIAKYSAPGGSPESPVWFNDLVLAPNGDVYATGGGSGLFRLRRGAEQVEPWFPPDGSWFNGITMSDDGRSIFAASHMDGVVKIDVATKARTLLGVPTGVALGGIDGLYFHEGSLVAVQNGTDPSRVIRAWLDPEMTRVTRFAVLEQAHPLSDIPLTGVIVGNDLYYVARSQLRAFENGKIWPMERLQETVILKLPLDPPAPPPVDLARERETLVEMYRRDVRAHIEGDAAWLADTTNDPFIYTGAGKIERDSRESVRQFFTGYFDGATYHQYEDLEPPIVRISDDGSMAWMITRTKVRRTQKGAERSFVYAGIMTYEKQNGAWVRVANVSTFE